MKLKTVSLILVLCSARLAKLVGGFCLVRNTTRPKLYSYDCFNSADYSGDIKAAPIDVPGITFTRSKIYFLRCRSFARLSKGLERLEISLSEIGKIEDNAFEGLVNLRSLGIVSSNLTVVKGAWFKGLANLKTISLSGNGIKRIEDNFFSVVPKLDLLDITANDLSCVPMNALQTFNTKSLKFRFNPLSWGCVSSLWNWAEKTNTEYDEFGKGHWDPSSELVLDCEDHLRKHQKIINEENIKNCAETIVADLLPLQGDYTVKKLCQFLKNKPSPYLTCS